MIGIYFSGTGNTKYCVEKLMQAYDPKAEVTSIEEENVAQKISLHSEIVIGYPVQFSNIPQIVKDFIVNNPSVWKGRNVFVVATMGLFSGDGAGIKRWKSSAGRTELFVSCSRIVGAETIFLQQD